MAEAKDRASTPDLDGSGLRVGIVSSRWNEDLVLRLSEGAERGLDRLGVGHIVRLSVPGAFELPFGAQRLARSGSVDAIVVLGAVVRGSTSHYELISTECARGVQHVQLTEGVPIGFGVLTVESVSQALERSEGPGGHNVGEEAAAAAVELALLSID